MNYFEMYKDVWNFHKKYQQVQTSDEYWDAVLDESSEIVKKHNNCQFIMTLILGVVDELERVCKEMMKNANTGV